MSYDLVIRNGNLIDGTGEPGRVGDLALRDGRIAAVGVVEGSGQREIDAEGHAITPGFVDIHTHYDGQATWDPQLAPSCYHGVTTAVMGNCGVGFAPVHPDPARRYTRASTGPGRASPSTSMRSSVGSSRWISARRCPTARSVPT
jgi:N-acyl-D-aspartate/D-glutamate deacylase